MSGALRVGRLAQGHLDQRLLFCQTTHIRNIISLTELITEPGGLCRYYWSKIAEHLWQGSCAHMCISRPCDAAGLERSHSHMDARLQVISLWPHHSGSDLSVSSEERLAATAVVMDTWFIRSHLPSIFLKSRLCSSPTVSSLWGWVYLVLYLISLLSVKALQALFKNVLYRECWQSKVIYFSLVCKSRLPSS